MLWIKSHLPALLALALLMGYDVRAESEFYRQFLAASTSKREFLYDASLVDTNNAGPALTNTPVSFSKFASEGKLSGLQLGMAMSEVVAAWGRPRNLHTRCGIGPRFWYGYDYQWGDVSLFFRGDRLERIMLSQPLAKNIVFDNGLTGTTAIAEWEKVLGVKAVGPIDGSSASIFYREKGLRTRFYFIPVRPHKSVDFQHYLCLAEVVVEPPNGHAKTQAEPLTTPKGISADTPIPSMK